MNPRYRYESLQKPAEKQGDSHYQSLIGTTVINPQHLMDTDTRMKLFFIFTDLSIRAQGDFCLRLQLLYIPKDGRLPQLVDSVFTKPFRVYPAKNFPGIKESSALSKHFWRQGASIPIKRHYSNVNHLELLE